MTLKKNKKGKKDHVLLCQEEEECILKMKNRDQKVVVLVGNGELQEGSNWEAIMFAAHHKLDNLILIVDSNRKQMLDFSEKIIDMNPLKNKFTAFGWAFYEIDDGHDCDEVFNCLQNVFKSKVNLPKVIVANTIKGKGVPKLEESPLAHILSLKDEEINAIIKEIENGE